MARYNRGRRRRFNRRRSGSSNSIVYVGKKRSKLFGFYFPTLLLVGVVAFIFRKHLTPLVDKIKGMFNKG